MTVVMDLSRNKRRGLQGGEIYFNTEGGTKCIIVSQKSQRGEKHEIQTWIRHGNQFNRILYH